VQPRRHVQAGASQRVQYARHRPPTGGRDDADDPRSRLRIDRRLRNMKTCGCKRSRSGEERSKTPVYKLAIIDFDGTICSTHDAVRHVIDLTFASFDRPAPDAAEVESAIGSGAVASDLFGGLLGLEPDDPERAAWAGRYR